MKNSGAKLIFSCSASSIAAISLLKRIKIGAKKVLLLNSSTDEVLSIFGDSIDNRREFIDDIDYVNCTAKSYLLHQICGLTYGHSENRKFASIHFVDCLLTLPRYNASLPAKNASLLSTVYAASPFLLASRFV